MLTLAAVTFSALKGAAIAVAAVNVVVLAAALAALIYACRSMKKEEKDRANDPFDKSPK